MKKRWRKFLRQQFLIGAMCSAATIMLIAAIAFTAHGGAALATDTSAAQDGFVQTAAPTDTAGLAITDTAIAADTAKTIARQEGIQPGAEQSVPIATTAAPNIIALKAAPATATITSSIVQAATALTHFQPAALTAT